MASLSTYIKKYGEVQGRKRYNRWHVLYRKQNKEKFLEYWKAYRKLQKARKDAASSVVTGL